MTKDELVRVPWKTEERIAFLVASRVHPWSEISLTRTAEAIGCTKESAGWYIRNAKVKFEGGSLPRFRINTKGMIVG